MGLILYLASAQQKLPLRSHRAAPGNSAQILFFTGVRYCRHEALVNVSDGEGLSGAERRRTKKTAA